MIDQLVIAAVRLAEAYEDGSWLDREKLGPKLDMLKDALARRQQLECRWPECGAQLQIIKIQENPRQPFVFDDAVAELLGPAAAVPPVGGATGDVEVPGSIGPPG